LVDDIIIIHESHPKHKQDSSHAKWIGGPPWQLRNFLLDLLPHYIAKVRRKQVKEEKRFTQGYCK
jgi:hypothetical protein